jgi:putative transposase
MNRAEGMAMIAHCLADLLVRQQRATRIGALPGLSQPATPDAEELALMRWLDEQYLATPFYGSRMAAVLRLTARQVSRQPGRRLISRSIRSRSFSRRKRAFSPARSDGDATGACVIGRRAGPVAWPPSRTT